MRTPADVLAEEISAVSEHLDQLDADLGELLTHAVDNGLVTAALGGRMCTSAAQRIHALRHLVAALDNLNSQETP